MRNGVAASGRIAIRIVCADMPGLLWDLNRLGVILFYLKQTEPLTITAEIEQKNYRKIWDCVKKYGASVKITGRSGSYRLINTVINRPVLLAGFVLLAILSVWLPGRILFVEVNGNKNVPTNQILESAEACGIRFGTKANIVRSEEMKNAILTSVPALQWAGVNTYGCRAVISVRERPMLCEEIISEKRVSSLVAVRNGIIQSCTATKGSAMCKPGQEVKEGDVLISGYTDCGLIIRATQAEGEVFALTERMMTVIIPTQCQANGKLLEVETRISIIIGKKRINFFKDSGILGTSCDKMYAEYQLILPGDLDLPMKLAVERFLFYEVSPAELDYDYCCKRVCEYATDCLLAEMISGSVLNSDISTEKIDDALILRGSFSCNEMIGRIRYEGIADIYGKSD